MQDGAPDKTKVFTDEFLVPAVHSINIILDPHTAVARVEYFDNNGDLIVEDVTVLSLELEAFSTLIAEEKVLYVDT